MVFLIGISRFSLGLENFEIRILDHNFTRQKFRSFGASSIRSCGDFVLLDGHAHPATITPMAYGHQKKVPAFDASTHGATRNFRRNTRFIWPHFLSAVPVLGSDIAARITKPQPHSMAHTMREAQHPQIHYEVKEPARL